MNYKDSHNFKLESKNVYISSTQGLPAPGSNDPLSLALQTDVKGIGLGYNFGGAFNFALQNSPTMVNLSALWDRVKCNEIRVKVIPEFNVATPGGTFLPTMRVFNDFDDANPPTSLQAWARRGKVHRLDKPFSISFKPKVLYQGTGNLNLIQKAPYMNNAYLNTPLYGLKFGIRDWPQITTGVCILRFEITYCVTMKQQQWLQVATNVTEYGILPANVPPPTPPNTVDVSGNVYDLSGNMIQAPDEFGWEHPWTGPTGLAYTGPTGPNPCNCY